MCIKRKLMLLCSQKTLSGDDNLQTEEPPSVPKRHTTISSFLKAEPDICLSDGEANEVK